MTTAEIRRGVSKPCPVIRNLFPLLPAHLGEISRNGYADWWSSRYDSSSGTLGLRRLFTPESVDVTLHRSVVPLQQTTPHF